MEPMETHTASTDSSTRIADYIATIRGIRDAFKYHTGPIKKRTLTADTMYFWLYCELHEYGGFEWHTIFSNIKPRPLRSLVTSSEDSISPTLERARRVCKLNSSHNGGRKVGAVASLLPLSLS